VSFKLKERCLGEGNAGAAFCLSPVSSDLWVASDWTRYFRNVAAIPQLSAGKARFASSTEVWVKSSFAAWLQVISNDKKFKMIS
jgi:hypothetical protein